MEQSTGLSGETKIPIYEVTFPICEFEANLLRAVAKTQKTSPAEYARLATLSTLEADLDESIKPEIQRIIKIAEKKS
jgi:hypothetical protein